MDSLKGGIVRSRLKQLVAEREHKEGRRILQNEIAESTGLRPATITKWMSPDVMGRIDDRALVALMDWLGLESDDMGKLIYIDKSHLHESR